MQSLCRLAFLDLRNEVWHGREEHVHPLHACLYGQGCPCFDVKKELSPFDKKGVRPHCEGRTPI